MHYDLISFRPPLRFWDKTAESWWKKEEKKEEKIEERKKDKQTEKATKTTLETDRPTGHTSCRWLCWPTVRWFSSLSLSFGFGCFQVRQTCKVPSKANQLNWELTVWLSHVVGAFQRSDWQNLLSFRTTTLRTTLHWNILRIVNKGNLDNDLDTKNQCKGIIGCFLLFDLSMK